MSRIWSFFIHKRAFSYLLIISMVAFGFYSLVLIPKESAPEVQVPIAIVTTVLPGAAPDEIEDLITNDIEDGLDNLDNLNSLTSSSRESVSVVVAEFDSRADIDVSIQEVKDEVDKVKPKLPADAEDPIVSEVNFVDQPIMLISVASEASVTDFITLTEELVDEVSSVSGVSRVEKSGIPEREVQVVVNQAALDTFNLRLAEVVSAIARANSSLPVGAISFEGIEYAVSFEGDITSPDAVGDIAVAQVAGTPVYVRDVAFVSNGVSDAASLSRVSIEGNPSAQSVTLSVFKQGGGDITRISDEVKEKLDELEFSLLTDSNVLVSFDVGEFVKEDLSQLSFTGLQTVILVMIILFLAIGWRASLVAGLAIPLSFLISFIGLSASGNTINFVSLFSLILAVGILVDSAIVVTESIYKKMKAGAARTDAALEAIRELHAPLTSGTTTTIAVFAPLFLVSGVTGQFIASIPFTIIFVLGASLLVALGIVPLAASLALRGANGSRFEKRQERATARLERWYRARLDRLLGSRKKENWFLIIITLLLIASFVLPFSGIVKVIFFPQEDADFLFVEIKKEEGTTLAQTDLAVRAVEEMLYDQTDVESFVTTVGSGSAFRDGVGGARFGNMTLILRKDRTQTSTEVLSDLRAAVAAIKTADVDVFQPSSGPPTGAPVVIKFLGNNSAGLQEAVAHAESVLSYIEGTASVAASSEGGNAEIVLRLDQARAASLGLDGRAVSQTLRTAVHGSVATRITHLGQDVDVVVKLNLNPEYQDPHDTARVNPDALRALQIETPSGVVLLGSIAEVSLQNSTSVIRHDDGERLETVSSELGEGAIARDILTQFEKDIAGYELPVGVRMEIGGENEDVDQSFRDMFVALAVGMILIFGILVLQFNSFREAFFIIIIVPFALIGIFTGLALTGKTLSFPSIMGLIALAGIVVNNSIILIDAMHRLQKSDSGKTMREVVLDASVSRLRPILLTTLTTVIGVIPLTYASEIWSPLAFSIMFGLSFAVVLTLILVPVLTHRWPGKAQREREKQREAPRLPDIQTFSDVLPDAL